MPSLFYVIIQGCRILLNLPKLSQNVFSLSLRAQILCARDPDISCPLISDQLAQQAKFSQVGKLSLFKNPVQGRATPGPHDFWGHSVDY